MESEALERLQRRREGSLDLPPRGVDPVFAAYEESPF